MGICSRDHITRDLRPRKESADRIAARRMVGPDDAVFALPRHVVRHDEAKDRRPFDLQDAGRIILNDRVVIDHDVAGAAEQQERVATSAPGPRIDVTQEVLSYGDAACLLARRVVVDAEDFDPRRGVAEGVAGDHPDCGR